VQLDRRKNIIRDEAGMIAKFGVEPVSTPDYLALVGDAADGYPGLAGWGAKSASKVLARYRHIESIPEDWRHWSRCGEFFQIVGDASSPLRTRSSVPQPRDPTHGDTLFQSVEELRRAGATAAFPPLAARLDASITKKKAARS
jgi:5'-3' exonuclease